jgi:hypothetical protein
VVLSSTGESHEEKVGGVLCFNNRVRKVNGSTALPLADTFFSDACTFVKSRGQVFLVERESAKQFRSVNRNIPFLMYSASLNAF